MKTRLIIIVIFASIFQTCSLHENDEQIMDIEEHKIQITAYSDDFELFAEADPFVEGKTSNILSHFSHLPYFNALEEGAITIRLIIGGKEIVQTLNQPTRKGIFSFDIQPETTGLGQIVFEITTDKEIKKLIIPNIQVYQTEEEAHIEAGEVRVPKTNTVVFTKEQSWKIQFATEFPRRGSFGQVIKTTAQVQSAQGDEILVSAKTNGIVILSANNVLSGKAVYKGNKLFAISGSALANDNATVRFLEAKNNFEKSKSNYERLKTLAQDKIISEKELINAKNEFDNARIVFDNLNQNFNSSGEQIVSPRSGFIKQVFVENGQYVEAGQAIVSIVQNKTLLLKADVQQKYGAQLGKIHSANIRTLYDKKVYSLKELNGRVLSFGKNANNDNYLIPINIQIDNTVNFIPGGFVEIYLKTTENNQALTIPMDALMEEQGSYFVFVQVTPELFEKREVKVGVNDGLRIEIKKGLAQTERIVVHGAIMIKLAQANGTLDAHSGHVH